VLLFLMMGIAAGVLTGVPIGPVNVAVIDAAYRLTLRRAFAIGIGGAAADTLYAALGILGVTPAINSHPTVVTVLYAMSGVVLGVYGFVTLRSQPVQPSTVTVESTGELRALAEQRREWWKGFSIGAALILMNPGAIVTWVVVVGQLMPTIDNNWEGVGSTVGVFLGSAGWFALVGYLTHKGKNVLGEKAAWLPRVFGLLLMVYAVYLIAKAVRYVVA
jgi:threonine/homoserine/homoserine lactone efflux protein